MAMVDSLMERRAQAQSGKPASNPDEESEEEFGFYYPFWYAYDTWIEHEEHGRYPEKGGYNDQDDLLMEDWKTLDRRYHRAVRGLKAGDPMAALESYKQAPPQDWQTL